MNTKVFKDDLESAAELIRSGGLVAVPTETVYGLAGNGLDAKAVEKIYEVKGRPSIKPLSLMVSGSSDIENYCRNIPPAAYALADKFWPGPLTIVLPAKDHIPSIVLAGGSTVGLRCPDHSMTLALLKRAGVPFAAPSANPSGEPSPKNAETVMNYFDGMIEGIVDGGECGIGTESTIISMCGLPYKILRQGALSAENIADVLVDNMTVAGITGGTGCGKTTALEVLEDLGALIIDCDKLYHRMLITDREMQEEIAERFPGTLVHGAVDRKALGKIVFADKAALRELNAITHRHIGLEIRKILREYAMQGGTLAAIDAIELISSGLAEQCSFTVAVTADDESRIRRIMERDGISRDYAELRLKAQCPNEYFAANCSYSLQNESTFEEFKNKCQIFFREVIKNG